jgi:hypothetical protein
MAAGKEGGMTADPILARENIARFRDLLKNETDESRRQTIRRLIAEFEAKLGASDETQHGAERLR